MKKNASSARRLAWESLIEYQKRRRDPDEILDAHLPPGMPERDRGLAWEIVKGTIRHLKKLDYIAQVFIKAPLRSQKPRVLAALRMGLYQLIEMPGMAQFAAVDETVSVLSDSGLKRDAGFVNAVLRSYIREPLKAKFPDSKTEPLKYLSTFHSFPRWVVKRWFGRYGYDETEAILSAMNKPAPTSFRVMGSKRSRDEIIADLGNAGVKAVPGRYLADYIETDETLKVIRSELFANGALMAQDEAQGIPLYLLNPLPGASVLDICSAPGGKTSALADMVGPDGEVISVDKDRARLKLVEQNIRRLKLPNVKTVCEDVFEFAPARKMEYILLDVPCTGFGTLPHNVDLKWSKREKDVQALAGLQRRMLAKAVEFLSDGGRLVYSTCTTEPEEIEEAIDDFLESHGEFHLQDSDNEYLREFRTRPGVYRTWPHRHGIGAGGFALLRKNHGE